MKLKARLLWLEKVAPKSETKPETQDDRVVRAVAPRSMNSPNNV